MDAMNPFKVNAHVWLSTDLMVINSLSPRWPNLEQHRLPSNPIVTSREVTRASAQSSPKQRILGVKDRNMPPPRLSLQGAAPGNST